VPLVRSSNPDSWEDYHSLHNVRIVRMKYLHSIQNS
jgi:hypothetical protein